MTTPTPTREQVIEWAKEAGLSFEDGWIFRTSKRRSLPEPEIDAFVAAMNAAYAAGRAQGLREAKEVCEREAKGFGGIAAGPFSTDFGKHTHNAMAAGAKNCAAAIEQLRGK